MGGLWGNVQKLEHIQEHVAEKHEWKENGYNSAGLTVRFAKYRLNLNPVLRNIVKITQNKK